MFALSKRRQCAHHSRYSQVTPSPDLYRFLDELAANAWPAQVQQAFGGWRLRATNGLTRRANSVLTAAPTPDHPEWLSYIEDFYERSAALLPLGSR